MSSHAAWSETEAKAIVDARAADKGAMLPILHDLQARFGYIDDAAIPIIASALNVSKAETVGVISFYHDFRTVPSGRHILRICRAEACQAAGGDALAARAESRLGIALGNTTADGRITVEPVYCLGLCSVSPSAMIDGKVVARLDAKKLDSLLAEVDR